MSYLLHFSALVRTEIEKKHIPKCIPFRSTFRKEGLYLKKVTHTVLKYTKEQHLDRGIQEIERYCNEHEMALTNIFTDQETGKNFNRPRYTVLVEDVLRPGDILIVTELDRLGRNKHDTMQQIQRIKDMGVRLMVLELWIYL